MGVDRSTLPPLDLVGPDGDRLTVRALDRTDTVDVLARRLGTDTLWTTRRELDPHERLADIDELCVGVSLDATPPAPGPGPERALVDVAVVAGPSTSTWQSLPAGRHLIGRARHAAVRLDDPGIEPHHALLRIDEDGRIEVVQLTGVVPIRVDGHPVEATLLDDDTHLSIGASVIRIRRRSTSAEAPSALGRVVRATAMPAGRSDRSQRIPAIRGAGSCGARRTTRRAGRAPIATAPIAPVEPQRPSFTGLIGTGVTACGAVVIATIMGNPMFMLFAAMGVIAAVTTFIVGVVTTRRKRTRLRAEHATALDAFGAAVDALHASRRDHHRRIHRTVADTLDEALDGGSRVWQRRIAQRGDVETGAATPARHEVALRAVVGTGVHRWTPPIEIPDRQALDSTLLQRVEQCARLDAVAAPISIHPGDCGRSPRTAPTRGGGRPFRRCPARDVDRPRRLAAGGRVDRSARLAMGRLAPARSTRPGCADRPRRFGSDRRTR